MKGDLMEAFRKSLNSISTNNKRTAPSITRMTVPKKRAGFEAEDWRLA
jgi:hypothetical protein